MAARRRRSSDKKKDGLDRGEFLSKLSQAAPAINNAGSITELKHLWFDREHIYAYNGGMGIRVDYPTELELGVHGETLLKLCKTGSGPLGIKLSDGTMTVSSGRSHVKLSSLPLSDFMDKESDERVVWPYPEEPGGGFELELSEELLDGLRRALLVKPRNHNRVEHYGVSFFPLKEGAGLYTTDDNTMLEVKVDMTVPRGVTKFILPRVFAEQLVAQCGDGAKLTVSDHLRAVGDGVTLYTSFLDPEDIHDMPKILGGIAGEAESFATIPSGFTEALDRMFILAGDQREPELSMEVNGGVLRVFGTYPLGELDEEFELDEELPDTEALTLTGPQLGKPLGEAEQFSVVDRAVVFIGGEDYTYVAAKKTKK